MCSRQGIVFLPVYISIGSAIGYNQGMELMIDTASPEAIAEAIRYYPVSGVTCNPSILLRCGCTDFLSRIEEILRMIRDIPLHIQVTGERAETMAEEARQLTARFGRSIYVKVPVDREGLLAIRLIHGEGIRITATAIYTALQGMLAAAAGADYLAVYCNRMEGAGISFESTISSIAGTIGPGCKVLGASFRNGGQVVRAIEAGAEAVTVDPAILDQSLSSALITDAVSAFRSDWRGIAGDRDMSRLL